MTMFLTTDSKEDATPFKLTEALARTFFSNAQVKISQISETHPYIELDATKTMVSIKISIASDNCNFSKFGNIENRGASKTLNRNHKCIAVSI